MEINYNAGFEDANHWTEYDPEDKIIKLKVPKVKENIPKDVSTILDVGCGNGLITNILSENYLVTGADISKEALVYVNNETVCCSSDNIPAENNSFDLVFSSELLEHLTDEQLRGTVEEFKRISRKYILITVPSNEYLPQRFIKCDLCSKSFHIHGHLQSLNEQRLTKLVGSDYKLLNTEYFGDKFRKYSPTLLRIRQNWGNRWFQPSGHIICPHCKNTNFESKKGNLISKFCNGLNIVVSSKEYYWILLLYQLK